MKRLFVVLILACSLIGCKDEGISLVGFWQRVDTNCLSSPMRDVEPLIQVTEDEFNGMYFDGRYGYVGDVVIFEVTIIDDNTIYSSPINYDCFNIFEKRY